MERERVRLVMAVPGGYLLEDLDDPQYPDTLGKFRFPGGGVEDGESREAAVVREAREEFGADLSGKTLRYLGPDPRPGWGYEHYFAVEDHGVLPGRYADAAIPGATITLFAGRPAGELYLGPDLAALMEE